MIKCSKPRLFKKKAGAVPHYAFTAFLIRSSPSVNTERGHAMFILANPSPPGPNR
ncbi:hypothetical protein SAMN05444955_10522 [Lihuaxuella thermophila]|uniref:Uncharacterized protein n=1 Tax=Lihuaxuella thermophila TaxID=1173111 RepID=A0A1H8D730_9BACL|nr:hypothetical protein SAMN05444955_10522 [Lihuaxuella thermophila]